MKYLFTIACLFTKLLFVSSEIYSSMAHIEDRLNYVKKINISGWIMKHFVEPEELRLATLKEVVKHAVDVDKLAKDTNELENPLNVYRFMKKLAYFKEQVQKANDTKRQNSFKEASFIKFLNVLPTKEDLNGSITGNIFFSCFYFLYFTKQLKYYCSGLARLQVVYNLSTEDVLAGILNGRPSRPLTAEEAMDIVTYTINLSIPGIQINNYTLSWLIHINNTKISLYKDRPYIKILRLMAGIYLQSRCYCSREFQHVYNMLRKVDPSYSAHIERFVKSCKKWYSRSDCELLTEKPTLYSRGERFFALCRGEPIKIPDESIGYKTQAREFSCMLQSNNDPKLLLNPVRVEILNKKSPYIAILHDIVTDREINFIKRVGKPNLKRGTVKVRDGQAKSDVKISKTMLMPNSHIALYGKLNTFRNRLVALTKLNKKSFKKVQVANYGVGGVYDVHVDFVFPGVEKNFTDATDIHLLTVVNYLTDVENGGMTVFPDLGIKVEAKKGNALIFYNLFRNGTGNWLTRHASCPVLYGNKWIANQWVLKNDQAFAYPCSLNKFE
ncbi:prolyl 4-hydroxylase subunit alpha-1-like [Mercenaria mercenaria]|uniref:prolyl 4-hydroxylase subunit alpha-1-like n=1 Tax=Mercenaria mercenaria TaxID=6596 RepID=UPI00234EE34B|nr:prolyl 4-hydroxylase subunit alpha-1-like [Mercenaria mercenaria]